MNNNEVKDCKKGFYKEDIKKVVCNADKSITSFNCSALCEKIPLKDCLIKQLLQLKAENEQLTQKLEKARELLSKSIHLECEICPKQHKDYDCSAGDCIDVSDDLAQQALNELNT